MEIINDPDQIRIRHIPSWDWVRGTVLLIVCSIICYWLINATYGIWSDPYNLEITLYLAAFVFVVAYFFVFNLSIRTLLFAAITTIVLNRKSRSVDLVRYGIFGKRTDHFYFNQLNGFKSYKPKRFLRSGYFLEVILSNNKKIKLLVPLGRDKLATTRFIKNLNKFIKSAQIPT
jgi:hypothetical protein